MKTQNNQLLEYLTIQCPQYLQAHHLNPFQDFQEAINGELRVVNNAILYAQNDEILDILYDFDLEQETSICVDLMRELEIQDFVTIDEEPIESENLGQAYQKINHFIG